MVLPIQPPPPPHRLSREFESGRITRTEFQRAMAAHARSLIAEMEECRCNPVAAFLESLRNRRAAGKLMAQHGELQVRSVLAALAEVPDFPPSGLLWNARDRQVPLFCFLRTKILPLFRVGRMDVGAFEARVDVEHQFGIAAEPRRESFSLLRDRGGMLNVVARRALK